MTVGFGEPGQSAGRNLVNTNNTYRKCEESCLESNGSFRNKSFANSWLYKHKCNKIITTLVFAFLALCFIISMIGVLFLFTAFFLGHKFNVITLFINECNVLTVLLICSIIGTHLLAMSVTGILGLGKHQWILLVHMLLGVGAVFTLGASLYFEPIYEPYVFEEVDMMMWCSLSHNRANYNSEGWDYVQFHMQCCGVNGYTDWCSYKKAHDVTKLVNKNRSISLKCHNIPNSVNNESTKSFNVTPDVTLQPPKFDLDSFVKVQFPSQYNQNESTFEDVQNNIIPDSLESHILEEEYTLVNCYVPATCCVVDVSKQLQVSPSESESCMKKNPGSNFYNRGCYWPIMQLMRHFVDSFMSIIKCALIGLAMDLPIVTLLIMY